MLRRAPGIAHVVEAVEVGDKVVVATGESWAPATTKSTRSETPASSAALRAASIEAGWLSKPMKREFGYAWAMMIVEAPKPQPMSATRAPRSSFSTSAGERGQPALGEVANVAGLEEARGAWKEAGSCSPQCMPCPVLIASAIRGSALTIEVTSSKPPAIE